MFLALAEFLRAGHDVVAEANFFRGEHEEEFARLPSHRLVQVHCAAGLEVLRERWEARTDRHPGHLDQQRLPELEARFASGANGPLDLAGLLVEVDTSRPVDANMLVERLPHDLHRNAF
jgi:hypothetical protein